MNETQSKPSNNPAGLVRVLDVGPAKAAQSAAKVLRELAEQADRGEIIGFHGIVTLPGGAYRVEESADLSRLQAAGALLDAAVARLGYAVRD